MKRRSVLTAQGAYYVGTGVIPFITRRGFEAVTGPYYAGKRRIAPTYFADAGIQAALLAALARSR